MGKTKGKQFVEIEASVPKDYKISFWYERHLDEMPESEQEHVKEMLEEGVTSGELVYETLSGRTNRGWWEVVNEGEDW